MWTIFSGTIINACTVAIGSGVGLLLGPRIPDRYQRIILDCLGLVTIILGVDASLIVFNKAVEKYNAGIITYGSRLAMVMVISLIAGAIIGTALKLHERLSGLGELIHARLSQRGRSLGECAAKVHGEPVPGPLVSEKSRSAAKFAEGFLSASVIFCVGPLTLLGCLNNGAHSDPSLLYIKSCLDCFCSMALAASLGLGVAFSILTILIFQGGLALLAHYVAGSLPDLSLQMMNVVGGFILIATALMILEIRKIPVANMLPGVFLPPLLIALSEMMWPHALMTQQ